MPRDRGHHDVTCGNQRLLVRQRQHPPVPQRAQPRHLGEDGALAGLGFERAIIYATGMANIRDVIPFARTPGHCEF